MQILHTHITGLLLLIDDRFIRRQVLPPRIVVYFYEIVDVLAFDRPRRLNSLTFSSRATPEVPERKGDVISTESESVLVQDERV